MRPTWKLWILLGSVLVHVVLLAALKMPEIAATVMQTAVLLNLTERPDAASPPPAPAIPDLAAAKLTDAEKKKGDANKKPDSEKKKKDSSPAPPPSPYAPAPLASDNVADGRPVVNPEPGGSPDGEAGGVPGGVPGGTPGGTVGGTGTGTGDSAPTPETKPPPPPEPVPVKPAVDVDKIKSAYVGSIKSKVYGAKFYPEEAKRMEHEGSVKVRFTVSASGAVSGVSVSGSSGFAELDAAAVAAVKNAAPFAAIPSELAKDSLTMSVTLKYHLN